MTDTAGSSLLREIAVKNNIPIQDFIIKQDCLCGSTIGPMIASKAGIKTVDIGAPQLSMHSIRETAGVIDMLYYKNLFQAFFNDYSNVFYN